MGNHKGKLIFFCQLYNYPVDDRYIDNVILIFLSVKAIPTQKSWFPVSGGSRMVIKGGLNNEDLRLTLKINGDLPLCNSDL